MYIILVFIIVILHLSCAKEETVSIERETVSRETSLQTKDSLKQSEDKEGSSKEEDSSEKEETPNEKESTMTTEAGIYNSPHIIIILADDLGWNDVSFHGSPQIPTPNIDALAANSIILNSYYTEPNCVMSRAALMSGQYSIHLGLQHTTIKSGEPTALPLNVTTMPEHFKNKGYATYMVGKWHLGYFKKEYTPIYRGFDSFFGFYNEQIDYYDYTNYQKFKDPQKKPFYGIDLQDGISPVKNFRGRYATEVFTEKAVNFIEKHNETKPLFLYVAHLATHEGNDYLPLQAPKELVDKYSHIQDRKRRIYAGMVASLDDSVGKIVESLKKRGFLENSIVIFASDNGGSSDKSSNFPLRGRRGGTYEGNIRVSSFIWSPLLKLMKPRTSNQLIHVSDWLPTLYSVIGGDISDLGKIDGYNMWKALINDLPSPRIEILHNLDSVSGTANLRRGDYKLISGSDSDEDALWYGSDLIEKMDLQSSMDEWVFKNESIIKRVFEETGLWIVKGPDTWRNETSVICTQPPPIDSSGCDPNTAPCLFNVAADPCEYNNLAARYPRIVRTMMRILRNYNTTVVEPILNSTDPRADPRCHGFMCVPWLDDNYILDCPYYYY